MPASLRLITCASATRNIFRRADFFCVMTDQDGRTRIPRRPPRRSGRMAYVSKIAHSRQHHHSRPAAEIPRTQSGRKHLAVHARQLALKPHLQILRRYRRSLLLRLEYARRPALENHVHRITPVGSWVLINEMWYNGRFRQSIRRKV